MADPQGFLQVARVEATTALARLFARFPDLDVAVPEDQLSRQPSFVGNSCHPLPVRLSKIS